MVNTFLPYACFERSARCLDRLRLGKQRLEAYQIILLLQDYAFLKRVLSVEPNDMMLIRKRYLALPHFFVRDGSDDGYKTWDKVKEKQYIGLSRKISSLTKAIKALYREHRRLSKLKANLDDIETEITTLEGEKIDAEEKIAPLVTERPVGRIIKLGYGGHPVVQRWYGYDEALKLYTTVVIKEWKRRGYRNTMQEYETSKPEMPPWMGDDAYHRSHRVSLVNKMPEHYGKLFTEDEL